MKDLSPTWSVAATVAEPVELLVAFAAYHRELGAQQIFLFLDDPRPGDVEVLTSIPGVQAIVCDESYWQARLGQPRPDGLTRVQRINVNYAYGLTSSDWLFHIDADEFIYAERPLHEVLKEVPETVDVLQVQNVERAYRPNETEQTYTNLFRLPFEGARAQERALFGSAMSFLNKGLTAYTIGKVCCRVGRHLKIGLHHANSRSDRGNPSTRPADALLLAHFDGVTPLNWMGKLLRYNEIGTYAPASGTLRGRERRKRARQIEYVVQHEGNLDELRFLHDLLKVVDAKQETLLTRHNLLVDLPIDPTAAIAKVCPWLRYDYGVRNIDAAFFARASAPRRELIKRMQSVA